ncbi:hypothetical protein TraAM80_07777 [Trypanosoma rangeli]|uniref:RING-type domain-containing protein n=1 Tax=Trypanosoma rangeli TaxID=5698 RepID=A0A3R7MCP8_TRYRA|nr:uncharacterized protein TraAM80_07777 [Trypanosoma rangeli]RNF00166.1 hypothetical protein TraAM80_07777 [Trypanosoma rangeli]|eukprot:RNF00166.1 hypothetical protein TraAM80_07777 [Trypanosoma rangeli]
MAVRALLQVAETSLVCYVCYTLLRSPVVFSCGHVFCKTCAERSIEGRPRCPLCNRTVASRRAITPLPTLARVMSLVHDVAKSLRLGQATHVAAAVGAGNSPPPQLRERLMPSFAAVDECSLTAAVRDCLASTSTVRDEDAGLLQTPIMHRDGSVAETQFLRTSPPPLAMLAECFVGCDENETQRMLSPSPTSSSSSSSLRQSFHQCVALRRRGGGRSTGAYEHVGCCALCGLDIADRARVRHFLRQLLHADPTCDHMRLQQLNEVMLSDFLGPMWDLRLSTPGVSHAAHGMCRKRSRSTNSSPPPSSFTLLVHQACLEWCVLHRRVQDTVTLKVAVTGTLLRELDGSSCASACSFCSARGRCLLMCRDCQRRAFHYSCALLTGAGVCNISAETMSLICAMCLRRHEEEQEESEKAEAEGELMLW